MQGDFAPVDKPVLPQHLSLAVLVTVNLLPLFGVLLFGWDVGALVVLYWSENLVIGFYTILKMLVVSPVGGLFSSAFFLVHFGGFCAVHGLFISFLLLDIEPGFPGDDAWPLFLIFVQLLVEVVRGVLALAPPAWIVGFLALALSHGISMVQNFFVAGERHRVSLGQLMNAPYSRVIVLHITIILGSVAVMALGQNIAMLLLLVVLKLGLDIKLHQREHRRFGEAPETAEASGGA